MTTDINMMTFVARKKSTGLAYALWFFLGLLSGHRFYAGQIWQPILQIISLPLIVGFIWLFIDLCLIPSMIRNYNLSLIQSLATAERLRQIDQSNEPKPVRNGILGKIDAIVTDQKRN